MLKVISHQTQEGLLRLVNGGVFGKRVLNVGRSVDPADYGDPSKLYKHPVAGLSLNWYTDSFYSVTFSGNLTYKEIIEELHAASTLGPNLYKVDPSGALVLAFWDDRDVGAAEVYNNGTANSYFGFPVAPAPTAVQQKVDLNVIKGITVDPVSRVYSCFYRE